MPEERGQRPEKEIIYVPAQGYMPQQDEDEIDLIELWNILWDRKWFIIGFVALCTAAAALVSLYVLTPKYEAQATLQVNEESKTVIANYLGSNKFVRRLVESYDLLPKLYPEKWDPANQEWKVQAKEIPTVEHVMSGDTFPIETSTQDSTIRLTWKGRSPEFCAKMLDNVINELREYLQNEYETAAQARINVLREEMEKLRQAAGQMENPGEDVLATISGMQSKIAELRGEDILAKRFSVIDDPIPPQNPTEPNPKLITGLSFVLSAFLAIFLVFFLRFVQTARQKQRERRG
jgi:capsular polysaccharide biosynthesis protein